MKKLLKNPITTWISWFIKHQKLLAKNADKNFHIGYGSYASGCVFDRNVTIYENVALHKVSLGRFSYVNSYSKISRTKIGNFCSIGENVYIGLGLHPSKIFVSTHPSFYSSDKFPQVTFSDKEYFQEYADVIIGNDVWIGTNSIILDGVNISDGVIVAAGSVVTKDIPPYAIVGGNPAKIIRFRFEQEQIELLLKMKWWNKEEKWLKENFMLMHDIKKFIKHSQT